MLEFVYLIKSLCVTFKNGDFVLDCFPGSINNFTVVRRAYICDITNISFRNNKF